MIKKKPKVKVKQKGLGSISNSALTKLPKKATVLKEVKRRVKSGQIKLPKGFDTKKSSVSILMDNLNKKKR